MSWPTLLSFVSLLVAVAGETAVAIHEQRHDQNSLVGFHKQELQPNTTVPVRIMMKQQNLSQGEEMLMKISDPSSVDYGKHLTQEQIINLFKPADEAMAAVQSWLSQSGVPLQSQRWSRGSDRLEFQTTVGSLEKLLSAEYAIYTDPVTHDQFLGTNSYSLPAIVAKHVDFVMPGISMLKRTNATATPRRNFRTVSTSNISGLAVQGCDQVMTPDCIRQQYNIPIGSLKHGSNRMGVFEEGEEMYRQLDLDAFFESYTKHVPKGTKPKVDLIDYPKGVRPDPNLAYGEAALDLQIAMPIIYPQRLELYQAHNDVRQFTWLSGFLSPWLDAIDGTYCNYDGGDDPAIDGDNPDKSCGDFKPTNVISVSYGLDEFAWSTKYNKRQCMEFLKLGLQGTTVLFSSGDGGVAGSHGERCLGPNGVGNLGKVFNPQVPASCPYITSVGATVLPKGSKAGDEETATTNFASGGGFSNIWTAPAYQKSHLDEFFHSHNPAFPGYNTSDGIPVPGGVYNHAGRGYPDVAALGDQAVVICDGVIGLSGGTSMSAPLFGAIMTRIIDERLRVGKKPLGFINPALYKNPSMFNDIVRGEQASGGGGGGKCDGKSFSAVSGWDPVTGLGTPKYPDMLKYFFSLP